MIYEYYHKKCIYKNKLFTKKKLFFHLHVLCFSTCMYNINKMMIILMFEINIQLDCLAYSFTVKFSLQKKKLIPLRFKIVIFTFQLGGGGWKQARSTCSQHVVSLLCRLRWSEHLSTQVLGTYKNLVLINEVSILIKHGNQKKQRKGKDTKGKKSTCYIQYIFFFTVNLL